MLLGDLGLWPLQARRNYIKMKFWFNLMTLDNNLLRKKVYLITRDNGKKTSWASYIRQLLEQYTLSNLWDDPQSIFNIDGHGNSESKSLKDHKNFWKSFIKSKIQLYEQKAWWDRINKKIE